MNPRRQHAPPRIRFLFSCILRLHETQLTVTTVIVVIAVITVHLGRHRWLHRRRSHVPITIMLIEIVEIIIAPI